MHEGETWNLEHSAFRSQEGSHQQSTVLSCCAMYNYFPNSLTAAKAASKTVTATPFCTTGTRDGKPNQGVKDILPRKLAETCWEEAATYITCGEKPNVRQLAVQALHQHLPVNQIGLATAGPPTSEHKSHGRKEG